MEDNNANQYIAPDGQALTALRYRYSASDAWRLRRRGGPQVCRWRRRHAFRAQRSDGAEQPFRSDRAFDPHWTFDPERPFRSIGSLWSDRAIHAERSDWSDGPFQPE
jgi:hypothetical protein